MRAAARTYAREIGVAEAVAYPLDAGLVRSDLIAARTGQAAVHIVLRAAAADDVVELF
jgi:hypothetical protein